MYWYEKTGGEISPVLSTRVRFARNLEGIPFPASLDDEGREAVFDRVREAYKEKNMMVISFKEADPVLKAALVDTRLSSPLLARRGRGCGLLVSRDGELSLMLGEEDHIRLQVIRSGKDIFGAVDSAVEWMRYGEERLPVAFREKLGYLTACPTNLGAAMRLSVMIHLPCLTMLGGIGALTESLRKAGFTVRGLFGEGSDGKGGIYQISNQESREAEPLAIAGRFSDVVERVEETEREARDALTKRDLVALEDRVLRALGTLRYARKMSYSEFITHFSSLRLGLVMGLEETKSIRGLDRLFIELQPGPMLLGDRRLSDETERDTERSRRLREALRE